LSHNTEELVVLKPKTVQNQEQPGSVVVNRVVVVPPTRYKAIAVIDDSPVRFRDWAQVKAGTFFH
jgi:hypothetical protein